jgi:hypothetical protein
MYMEHIKYLPARLHADYQAKNPNIILESQKLILEKAVRWKVASFRQTYYKQEL